MAVNYISFMFELYRQVEAKTKELTMHPIASTRLAKLKREIQDTIKDYDAYRIDHDEYVERAKEYAERLEIILQPFKKKDEKEGNGSDPKTFEILGISPWLIGGVFVAGLGLAFWTKRRR